ncbi:hypothetical protein C8R44DRAFT_814065 [Mycena epipterygia]|nr:hypothetical protein C8R44DRAFT_814065 [Mycena epipterygia]
MHCVSFPFLASCPSSVQFFLVPHLTGFFWRICGALLWRIFMHSLAYFCLICAAYFTYLLGVFFG